MLVDVLVIIKERYYEKIIRNLVFKRFIKRNF